MDKFRADRPLLHNDSDFDALDPAYQSHVDGPRPVPFGIAAVTAGLAVRGWRRGTPAAGGG